MPHLASSGGTEIAARARSIPAIVREPEPGPTFRAQTGEVLAASVLEDGGIVGGCFDLAIFELFVVQRGVYAPCCE